MQAITAPMPSSKPMLWVGRVISGFAVLFLVFDAVIKVINIQVVVDSSKQLGLPVRPRAQHRHPFARLSCRLSDSANLCAWRDLLTGYLGGAIAIQCAVVQNYFHSSSPSSSAR